MSLVDDSWSISQQAMGIYMKWYVCVTIINV